MTKDIKAQIQEEQNISKQIQRPIKKGQFINSKM